MMHKKSRKQFAEDKQTKDMDYWNHVLWSDKEYKDKCVLLTVKHGGGSVMVWCNNTKTHSLCSYTVGQKSI